jgi:hypothetical protein
MPAFAGRRVFSHISGSAAILAAQRQALQHAQAHQHDRRGDPDGAVGRQQADREGRHAHQHDGHQEGVFAPDHVTQAPEHECAEGPHQEAGSKGHQGEDERGCVVDPGKELLADDRRQRAIEKKVIPLENRPKG